MKRKRGQTATTKQEDVQILKKFKALRPPGHYIDSRMIHTALPKKLSKKIGKRTVSRRMNAKGFFYQEKRSKDDPSEAIKQRRVLFCRAHSHRSFQLWQSHLQAVADLSDPLSARTNCFVLFLFSPGPILKIRATFISQTWWELYI